jgi:large subunit ribosomal protein L9
MELVIPANAGGEGKLFGSIGPIDLASAFEKVGVEVSRSEVRMPDGPIHETGEFVIGVHLHTDVNVEVTLRVVEED